MAKYRRRFVDRIEDRDPTVMWKEHGDGYVLPHDGRYIDVGNRLMVSRNADILLQTRIINLGQRVARGQIVSTTTRAWSALRKEVLEDPSLLQHFRVWYRKFEEFVAGAYRESHWSDVVLTPRSNDHGFDIAAQKRGRRILDETKAYKPSLLVTHQIVRAALGLLISEKNVHQVRVTTTSSFAPRVFSEFSHLIPGKLGLRDQQYLLQWLRSIGSQSS